MLDKQGYMHTHKCVIFIAFPRQQRLANAPQYYGIRTSPVLFSLTLVIYVKYIYLTLFATQEIAQPL